MTLLYLFLIQTNELATGASETLKDLSPWAYVIVVLALAVAGTFLKLYISEKNDHQALQKEYRNFMAESLSQQIEVSKDVIDLVTRSKEDVKDALVSVNSSDLKIENLISEVKNQLSRIEQAITRFK